MRFRVLGPLQVEGAGDASLGGPKEQAVLAQLLAHPNAAVPASRLAFGLWGDAPPPTAERTLQAYITRLRRVVEPSRGRPRVIVTAADGWLLRVEPDSVDAGEFEALVRDGRSALAAGRAGEAAELFTSALSLWRGAAYAGFDDLPGCHAEALRLGELRLLAEDERLAALLIAGDAPQVAAEAQALLAAEPLRESRWALLIRAQYAAGRQADALAALGRAREVLRDELGTDLGPELQRLQTAVLTQDPALIAAAETGQPDLPEVFGRGGPRLVGREAELDRLITMWAAARTGVGGAFLVDGAAGIGKSRVVAELARYAAAHGAIVRHVTANAEQTAPCAALRAVLTGGSAPYAITSDHTELAAAARVLAGSGRPVLLVIDDLEQADVATTPALIRLAKEAGDLPLLLVGVFRLDASGPAAGALRTAELPRLRVGPLADEAVVEIVGLYAGEGFEIDVAEVVAGATGSPLRAHQLASDAATRITARRIRVAALRAERGRQGLGEIHEELAEGVLAAERIRRQTALYLPASTKTRATRSPYQGLAAFDVDDAEVFFGRERVVADLVARLASGGFLAVVGSSGCGKSSLVRAGLVPALLTSDSLPAGGSVDIRTPRDTAPQRDTTLDEATRLLVIDQLEEAFAEGSVARVDELVAEIVAASRHGTAIVTLRSDFYADASAHPELGPMLESGTALLGPMRLDELRRAVIEPAVALGLDVADDLVEAVVQDVAGEPGALPLLSVALLETYRRRDGNVLRLNTYEAAGGLTGALARLAEQAYGGLSQPQRRAARRVLTRLADEDHGRWVRRRTPLTEICPPGDADAAGAIEAMARRRLLVVADDTVEVAHEALLSAWPRYREWLADDSAGRQIRSQVTAAAGAWDAGGRADADLYRGVRLGAAAEWEAAHADEVTDLEREFLTNSRVAAEREHLEAEAHAALRERQARRLRFALIAVAGLLTVSLAAGLVAVIAADRARTEATAATAARLGNLALTEPRVDLAALLAAQAVALHPSAEARSDLLSTLLRRPEVRRVTVPTGGRLLALAVSPDGRTVAVGDNRGGVALVDAETWQRRGPILETGPWRVWDVSFSPDGRLLLATSQSRGGPRFWVVTVWDLVTNTVVQRADSWTAARFRWAPAGRAVVGVSFETAGLAVWQGPTGTWTQVDHDGDTGPVPVGFTPDGRRVLVAEWTGWATWYDTATWRPVARIPISPHETYAELSSDGRVLAVGDDDGTIRLLDPTTGRVRHTLSGQRGNVQTMRFDSPGRHLVATTDDGTAVVWDASTGARLWSYSGLGGQLGIGAGFASSGQSEGDRLFLAAHDGTLLDVSLKDTLVSRRVLMPDGAAAAAWPAGAEPVVSASIPVEEVSVMAAVPGSSNVVAGSWSGEVALLDPTGALIRQLRPPIADESGRSSAYRVAAAPGGERIFVSTTGLEVLAYDGRTGERLWNAIAGTSKDPLAYTTTVAYDPVRNRLAAATPDYHGGRSRPGHGDGVAQNPGHR
jgi:DNA-binding SARP family transcriptional activator/WD40 repeat protein